MKKKVLSFVLCFAMLLTLAPMTALALEVENCTNGEACTVHEAAIGTTHYTTLEEAVAAAQATTGCTIDLLTDVTLETTIQLDAPGTFVIDGNGHQVFRTGHGSGIPFYLGDQSWTDEDTTRMASHNYTLTDLVFADRQLVVSIYGVTATISDCSFTNISGQAAIRSMNACADVTVDNCTFTNNTCLSVYFNSSHSDASFVVKNSTFTGTNTLQCSVIYFVGEEPYFEASDNTFTGNIVTSASNAGVIYADTVVAKGNTFTNNKTTADLTRAGVVVADDGVVTGNVFSGNTQTSASTGDQFVATVVAKGGAGTTLDASSNYWDGGKPDFVDAKPVDGEEHISADNYYTTVDSNGTLGGLVGEGIVVKDPAPRAKYVGNGQFATENVKAAPTAVYVDGVEVAFEEDENGFFLNLAGMNPGRHKLTVVWNQQTLNTWFDYTGDFQVMVPDSIVVDPPKTGDCLNVMGIVLVGLSALAMMGLALRKREN